MSVCRHCQFGLNVVVINIIGVCVCVLKVPAKFNVGKMSIEDLIVKTVKDSKTVPPNQLSPVCKFVLFLLLIEVVFSK